MAAQPLSGKRVVVTRARGQASQLAARLSELGAVPVELPTIEIVPPDDGGQALQEAVDGIAGYDWLVLTSVNTVRRLLPLLDDGGLPAGIRVAAIGPGTAEALVAGGISADVVPSEYVAESLVESFPSGNGRVLLPRAAVARDVLPEGLRAKGWDVLVVDAYRTVEVEPDAGALQAAGEADVITFTASSTVTNYVRVAGTANVPPIVACIGPITAGTARKHGINVDIVAEDHTIDGLVKALVAYVS